MLAVVEGLHPLLARLRTNPSTGFAGGGLLDLHPESAASGGCYRLGLRAGESFTTPNGHVTLTVLETTPEYATMKVPRNVAETRWS